MRKIFSSGSLVPKPTCCFPKRDEEDLFFRRRKKRSYTHHLDSTLVGTSAPMMMIRIVMMMVFQPKLEQAAPYEATFRSLRVSIDYSIKISFIIDGHTLGVVDFTIAAEERSVNFKRAILSKISFSQATFYINGIIRIRIPKRIAGIAA